MKPLINLNELGEGDVVGNGKYGETSYAVSELIGAKKLGYSVSVVPPDKRVCPFHNHRHNEEMFLILEGEGTLRFGKESYPVKPLDIIACPPGGEEVAHQLVNTGTDNLIYLCLSTNEPIDVCEYPDSGKVLSMVGEQGNRTFRHISRKQDEVDYFDGEM
ncbi:cupin domain-containing protein [Shewanella corallii]|uniref:Cupin domain-containing protein n=1 Tax=Shewanella corallii TaxID=560080 RepID=A0ABT0N6S6_9GAMM|nr:cupin domain-containing protein [Shewanella corallii]MCL2914085.1 cupin domain-containing protein [Shewanella corallii]